MNLARNFLPPAIVLLVSASSASADAPAWLKQDTIDGARRAVVGVVVEGRRSAASGFFVTTDGLIVTSATPLEGARKVVVLNSKKEEIKDVRLVALDPRTDLAVLATGKRAPGVLEVREELAAPGDACAVIFQAGGNFPCADGKLLARRKSLDWTETRFIEVWSVALDPRVSGLTGAPVIAADGRVCGMCDLTTTSGSQKFILAIPESDIRSVLKKARAAGGRGIGFPKIGDITGVRGVSLVAANPDYVAAMQFMGAGEFDAALKKFRSTLERHPKNPLLLGQMAHCLSGNGENEEAERLLQEVIRIAPERVQPRLALGTILEGRGDAKRSVRYYEGLTKSFPELADAWGGLGVYLLKTKDRARALAALKRWSELAPDSIDAWTEYSLALSVAGNYEEGRVARSRASQLETLFFRLRYSSPKRD